VKINPTKTINELITVMAYVADIEKNKKIYHAWRVAMLSAAFAQNIVTPRNLKEIFYAALLHDIGAVGFPFHIIHYLKRNDKISRNILLSHPIVGAHLVSNIPQMNNVAKLILDHHEWINGKGYPRSKTQKYIPFGSQVIRLADSVDILLHTGRYSDLKEMKNRMSLNIDKEYSKRLFNRAFGILKKNRFFYGISKPKNIPGLFEEIKNRVGFINVPFRLDAIGKALEAIAQIIDMKHPYTSGHSLRVSRYAMAIALSMNFKHDEITQIKWAGLIHDVGKFLISREIMNKPATLTPKEFKEVKRHALLTYKIVGMLPTLKEMAFLAASHHEFYDGSGYPRGLKEEEIPLGARILAICDAFDAMTSNRPYRNPMSVQAACQQIKKLAGKQFDPKIAKEAIPLFLNLGL
jgi:HD-GYP domain-containing protein (c-di-GMP phosphodiesterase class II)